jgi:hypothetical protein
MEKYPNKVIINISILFLMFLLIIIFGLDLVTPYPKKLVVYFNEPIVKIAVYLGIYHVSYYNPVISVILMIAVLLLHADMIMLVEKNICKNTK